MRSTGQTMKTQTKAERLADLVSGYAPLPGIPDELIGADGRPRAAWKRFLDALTSMTPAEIESRFATADRHIRDTGVSYRALGETALGILDHA